jgi:hypothetical protein
MKNFLLGLCGLALGIGLGLGIAWWLLPVKYIDTTPATLRTDFKDEYRLLIAQAYTANPDLLRARARLGVLGDTDPVKSLGGQVQRTAPEYVQLLTDFSTALQTEPTQPAPAPRLTTELPSPTTGLPVLTASPTPRDADGLPTPVETATVFSPATATPESLPTLTETPMPLPTLVIFSTPRPSPTSTPTPGAPFQLVTQATFCEPTQPGLLQVYLTDSSNRPAAGVELVITWQGGEEHFFTGLKPDLGYGYADYRMTDKTEYALSLSAGSTRVTGLSAPICLDTGGKAFPGGLRLELRQP